ncbi:speckle-type POZ protein-like B [Argiope bruennichi]|uniref:speckle-type POZ protein-like B n=1 Tax=Argiope bruennichi TaxID=94029 RepID=UPI002494DB1E|nr:speckle-type POZ protein-like B [Argiope bruennichi]
MPHFPVKFVTKFPILCDKKRNRFISKVDLSDEWFVIFASNSFSFTKKDFECNSVEILHKKITNEEFSIRGILSLVEESLVIFHKDFSEIIKPGTSYKEIISDLDPPIYAESSKIYILLGIVYIESISDVFAKEYLLKDTKKGIQLTSMEKLLDDFGRLLDPKTSSFSDVVLKCGDVSIPAHKNILSVRSPVFEAMFSNPMKESHKNEVSVIDIDETTVRNLLIYIYTGTISDLTDSSAADLLFAADKYQLQDLKTLCCGFLKNTMSLQNVLNILVLGELHADDLKSFAIEYICNKCTNFSTIEELEEWKTLRKDRPALAMDVLTSLINILPK